MRIVVKTTPQTGFQDEGMSRAPGHPPGGPERRGDLLKATQQVQLGPEPSHPRPAVISGQEALSDQLSRAERL